MTDVFPPQFDYERVDTVDAAVDRLSADPETRVRLLAGGHGLIPDLKDRRVDADLLVDVSGIAELRGIDAGDEATTVGALTTHARLAGSDTLREHVPVLAEAAAEVGDRQVRNRGTLGGNLVEADPAADLPAATIAADATLTLRGPEGERTVPVDEFFAGDGETGIRDDELLTAITFPSDGDGAGAGSAYARKKHPASGFATVGVAVRVDVEDGTVASSRVAATGVADRPVRLRTVEDTLLNAGVDDAEAVANAADRAPDALADEQLRGDHHASAAYRRNLLTTYVERTVQTALDRATAARGGDET